MSEFSPAEVTNMMRSAKRRTFLRGVIISAITTIGLGAAIFFSNRPLLDRQGENAVQDYWAFSYITNPDVSVDKWYFNHGFLSGSVEIDTVKTVEGVPVTWGPVRLHYNWAFHDNTLSFKNMPRVIQSWDPKSVFDESEYSYGANQRLMRFFYPATKYEYYDNDFKRFPDIPKEKVFELGLSFDKSYSLAQVSQMMPKHVHVTWCWVDTGKYAVLPTSATPNEYAVIGFPVRNGETFDDGENLFLKSLKTGLQRHDAYYSVYQTVSNYLKGASGNVNPADLRVSGVVVTGNTDSLNVLRNMTFIRAASLGTVVSKY